MTLPRSNSHPGGAGSLRERQRQLPVYAQRERILSALESHRVVVVESPTGSGKTTQLPIILDEAGYGARGVIGVTQPRRIAAVSVSSFVAKQLETPLGEYVGYKMRFEDHTTAKTRIKIMTDGILLQEIKADYALSAYSTIVVDEAHERSLNIDFVLGLLKRVIELRPDFRVVVSSATINAEVFSQYFDNCPVVRVDASMYPVQVIYDPPALTGNYDELMYKIADIVGRGLEEHREGDYLIFLPGEQSIKDCLGQLAYMPFSKKLHLLPLYGRLSKEEQDRVFPPAPAGKTKVVVATNIAETSITIDGITTVIDAGTAKMNYYNPRTFTSSLIEGPISKASANQRKGRAGRTRPGLCYRLYTREEFESRPLFTMEEIYRTDLSEVVLRMAEIGIRDFESFDFLSPPGRGGILGAVDTLLLLDALNEDNSLSTIGKMMARYPLLPRHSRAIVEAIVNYPDVVDEVLTATAFLSTNSPFLLPQGEEVAARKAHHRYRDDLGDFVPYLKLLAAYESSENKQKFCETRYLDPRVMAEIKNVKEQLAAMVSESGVPLTSGGPVASYLCAVARGLIQFVCVRTGRGNYRSLTAQRIMIHPGSVMFREDPEFIVAGEIVRTSRTYARSVSPLERSWIPRISENLASELLAIGRPARGGGKKGKAATEPRDTTWQVVIGATVFRLEPYKGKKKVAVLPWDQVRELVDRETELLPHHSNLRGKVMANGRELMTGMRLPEIFRIAKTMDFGRMMLSDPPAKRTYQVFKDPEALCKRLGDLLKPAPIKKSSKQTGFLTLHTDEHGQYWIKPTRNFYTAVDTTLYSLEVLADELQSEEPLAADVGAAYRRVAAVYDE